MDVWVVLSQIADAIARARDALLGAAGPSWPAYAVAGACIVASGVLLLLALLRRTPAAAAPDLQPLEVAPLRRSQPVGHGQRRADHPRAPQPLAQTAFDDSEYFEDEFEHDEPEWEEPPRSHSRARLPAPRGYDPEPREHRGYAQERRAYVPERRYAEEPRRGYRDEPRRSYRDEPLRAHREESRGYERQSRDYDPEPRGYVAEPRAYRPEPRAAEPRGYVGEPPRRRVAPQPLQLPAPRQRTRPAMIEGPMSPMMDKAAPSRVAPAAKASVGPPPKKWWSRRELSADEGFAQHAAQGFVTEATPQISMEGIPSTLDAPALSMTGLTRELLGRLEAKRGSRVVAIVHRENSKRNWLDVIDLEDALTAIRKAPKNKPLDIILHSAGGMIRASQQIARAIHAHPAKTTVFVPYYALGSTTFMAFAADEIVMSPHAALSPVDPFVGAGPASSVLAGIRGKPVDRVEDETIIAADIAEKMLGEARRLTCELMTDGRAKPGVGVLADELVSGKWSRDRAITAPVAKELGLNVSLNMPNDVYELVRSCRRASEHEGHVAYLDEGGREIIQSESYRDRPRLAAPVGVLDSGIAAITERDTVPAVFPQYRRGLQRSVWLAHAGVEVPAASAERAEGLIRRIEQARGSRVVCVIHGENMENDQFNFADLEDVLSALVASDPTRPLDVILHTQGGNSFAGRQIARAIKSHPARKTVFVPYYAMSAGTRVALAADQIVMGAHATLGPIDTQLYGMPAPSILQLLNVKPQETIRDEFLILAEEARKIMAEGHATACDLLQDTYSDESAYAIADEMIGGKWSHGFPIMANVARALGLNVSTDLPDIFYELVRCFRHSDGEDPSVLFIPR